MAIRDEEPTFGEKAGAVARTIFNHQVTKPAMGLQRAGAGIAGAASSAFGSAKSALSGFSQGFNAGRPLSVGGPERVQQPNGLQPGNISPNFVRPDRPLLSRSAQLTSPPPNSFVGSRTGVRTLDASGAPSPISGGAGVSYTPSAVASVITRPSGLNPQAAPMMAASGASQVAGVQQIQRPVRDAAARAARSADSAINMPTRVLDPRSMDSELVRRADNAMQSARVLSDRANRPATLRAAQAAGQQQAQAWLGQLAARNGAAQAQAQGDTRNAGRLAEVGMIEAGAGQRQAADLAAQAQEGAANRSLAEMGIQRPMLTRADGSVGLVGRDGALQPITNPDGTPVIQMPTRDQMQPGAITPQDAFGAMQRRIDGLYGQDIGTGAVVPPTPEQIAAVEAQFAPYLGASTPQARPAATIAVGTEKDGYRYKGGDPSSPTSWEQL